LTGDHTVRRTDVSVDLGASLNPAIDIGQIEGAFIQGMGWSTTEEIIWGDDQHTWIRPTGRLHTAGPGTYKIPAFNDTPHIFNVSLFENVANRTCVHSSKAVGEPPFFLGATVLFAIQNALMIARNELGIEDYCYLYSPATSERIRMSIPDEFAQKSISIINSTPDDDKEDMWQTKASC
jgi:xanthine dehydrogenase/oxidase